MSNGIRQTFYFKNLEMIRQIAEEESIEANGSTFEKTFFEKYIGDNDYYNKIMTDLYNQKIDMKAAIMQIIEYMAYSDNSKVYKNLEFVKIIRDITIFDNIASDIYKTNIYDIVSMLNYYAAKLEYNMNTHVEPWKLPICDEQLHIILKNPDNYNKNIIENIKLKENMLKNETHISTPIHVINAIIENWDYIWNRTFTYQHILYCLEHSNAIQDKPQIRKRIREFLKNV